MSVETLIDGDILTVSRSYDAPIADVFDAWIDAGKTTHWWGCESTSKVVSTIDPQKGGCYQHVMTIDGVGEHLINGTFTAFEPPNLLAYDIPGMARGLYMHIEVKFERKGTGTLVTLVQSSIPIDLEKIITAGWTATLERLSKYFNGERRAA